MKYLLRKQKAHAWSTNHSLQEIQEKLANGKITGDWLVCPLGEAARAVPVAEFIACPTLFESVPKTVKRPASIDPAQAGTETDRVLKKPFDRRHDLDALRAIAMLLGIGLHGSLAYVTFRFWPVYDGQHHAFFDTFNAAVHGFRMPLFFMISGFFTAMLWRKRGLSSLIKHRAKRILLPLLIFLIPVQLLLTAVIGIAAKDNGQHSDQGLSQVDLWSAAKSNDIEALKRHLANEEAINNGDPEYGIPALNWAALNGSTEAARLLIERGADVNVRTEDGSVPLGHAAFTGRADIVALLIEKGAELNPVNSYQSTPLDASQADWGLVQLIAGTLGLQVDRERVEAGQKVAADLLRANGGKWKRDLAGETVARANTSEGDENRERGGITDAYLSLTDWQGFREFQIFGYLWFLWFLCILIISFAVFARIAAVRKWPGPPRWLFLSPLLLVWLVPVTMIPQWLHGLRMPGFGPDTSMGLFPMPHIVLLYAVFFYFGVLYFDCDDEKGKLGRFWGLTLPVALLVVFPLGMALSFSPGSAWITKWLPSSGVRLLAVLMQALYPWLMIFGLIGLFRKICSRENKVVRYISDSSYWLYIAHLPLIVIAQYLVKPLDLPAFAKFGIVCAGVTGILLISYDLMIRYTWIGSLLNGKRERPRRILKAAEAIDQRLNVSGD